MLVAQLHTEQGPRVGEEEEEKENMSTFAGFDEQEVRHFQVVERRDDNGNRELQLFVAFVGEDGIYTGILDESGHPECNLRCIRGDA